MSFVQLIKDRLTEAIIKVSGENPAFDREGELTAEEARDSFIALLMAELFPEHGNEQAVVVVPVVEPEPVVQSPVKKLTKEEKAEAKAAKEAAKAEAKAAKEAEKLAKAEAKAAEKAAKAEAKAAKKSPKAADVELPASPKVSNVPKIDPTWRKLLKEADKEHAKELEPELLKYLNSIANAVFNDKPARQHVAEFLAARRPVEAEPSAAVDLDVVEFNGKDYYVNPETKRVYEGVMDSEGNLTVTKPVGYVGMAEFKDMELDDSDEE